jgi:putative mRNA 3-end processing factor
MKLLEFTDKGIYCEKADIYIDAWQPVDKVIVTHGHADHARWGSKHYLCHTDSEAIIRWRLGDGNTIESKGYNEPVVINGVEFSFHPAGHIIGSAQVKVTYKGETWVVSGDYKLENDGLATPFEPICCDVFITESTFGLPVYKWKPQEVVFTEINEWWAKNAAEGKASLLTGYSLGKAQRLLQGLNTSIGPVFVHGAIDNINQVIMAHGIPLKSYNRVTADMKKDAFRKALILAPPSAANSPWTKRFQPFSLGIASGWMSLRGTRRRRAADRGFVLSDHADWDGLNQAIIATGAKRVIITHGYRSIFARWLNENGYHASVESTQYEGELSEIGESTLES